jgi:hypothetical protein
MSFAATGQAAQSQCVVWVPVPLSKEGHSLSVFQTVYEYYTRVNCVVDLHEWCVRDGMTASKQRAVPFMCRCVALERCHSRMRACLWICATLCGIYQHVAVLCNLIPHD